MHLEPRDRFYADQMAAHGIAVGFVAFNCMWRAAVLYFRAKDLPPGEERSRMMARALKWERRAKRWDKRKRMK